MNYKNKFKILIRLPGGVSDMLQALPLVKALRNVYVDAEISVLVLQKYKGIFRKIAIDHVIFFQKKPRFSPILENGEDVISFIQRQEYDLGIILPHSFSSAFIFYQGMVKRRIGFTRPFGSFMLTDKVEGDNFADLLKPLNIEVNDWEVDVYAKTKKHSHLHIGISCSFNNEMLTNRWYRNLIDFILVEIPYVKIFILGKESNYENVQKLIGDRADAISNQCKATEITDLIDTINNFEVFVSDDKGLLDIAKAVNTPYVNIIGQIEKHQLLPEDFFQQIKDAILQPLKDRSFMHSLTGFLPISQGIEKQPTENYTKKNVGVIILAGGMGRRLGLNKPKGLLTVGDKCLYDILLEKSEGAAKIGILTSPITYSETKSYCEGKNIDIFCKKVYPTESFDGVSPEGNGALFDAVVYSKYWDDWKDLDLISVIAVDNPLADPLDIDLLATKKQLAVIGVQRNSKEQRLGVLCKKAMALAVREYFTLGKDGMKGLGYSGSFAAKPEFFKIVSKKKLPFYRVEKKNEVFYERLLIDGFMYATSFDIIEKKRKDCFFPIKEKRDLFTYYNTMNIGGEK